VKKLRTFESDVEVANSVLNADQVRLPRNSPNPQQVVAHREVWLSAPGGTWFDFSRSDSRVRVLTQPPAGPIIETQWRTARSETNQSLARSFWAPR
jgi:hypothetical protein